MTQSDATVSNQSRLSYLFQKVANVGKCIEFNSDSCLNRYFKLSSLDDYLSERVHQLLNSLSAPRWAWFLNCTILSACLWMLHHTMRLLFHTQHDRQIWYFHLAHNSHQPFVPNPSPELAISFQIHEVFQGKIWNFLPELPPTRGKSVDSKCAQAATAAFPIVVRANRWISNAIWLTAIVLSLSPSVPFRTRKHINFFLSSTPDSFPTELLSVRPQLLSQRNSVWSANLMIVSILRTLHRPLMRSYLSAIDSVIKPPQFDN